MYCFWYWLEYLCADWDKVCEQIIAFSGILRFKMLNFHVSHPSLVVYPLHVALMKFSLRCVISWHPWMSPKLVVMMVSLPEC